MFFTLKRLRASSGHSEDCAQCKGNHLEMEWKCIETGKQHKDLSYNQVQVCTLFILKLFVVDAEFVVLKKWLVEMCRITSWRLILYSMRMFTSKPNVENWSSPRALPFYPMLHKTILSIYLKSVIIWFDPTHVTNVGIFLDVWCGNTSSKCVFRNSKVTLLDCLEVMEIYTYFRICDFYIENNNKPWYLTISCSTRWRLLLKVFKRYSNLKGN